MSRQREPCPGRGSRFPAEGAGAPSTQAPPAGAHAVLYSCAVDSGLMIGYDAVLHGTCPANIHQGIHSDAYTFQVKKTNSTDSPYRLCPFAQRRFDFLLFSLTRSQTRILAIGRGKMTVRLYTRGVSGLLFLSLSLFALSLLSLSLSPSLPLSLYSHTYTHSHGVY